MSAPQIVGGLSTLSKAVRLKGQLVGARVTILRNGAPIGHGTASAFDQIFAFDAGVTLAFNDKITAMQELDGFVSGQTPVPTLVQQVVAPHSGHRFVSHIYRCGESVFVAGIVPGATVHIHADNNDPRGNATSVDGGAVVLLTSPTGANEQLVARQLVNNAPGGAVESPAAEQPPQPLVILVDQPYACASGIMVHGIDGAQVMVRTDASDASTERTFHLPVRDLFLPLPTLQAGQKLLVRQFMYRCELVSPDVIVEVQPLPPSHRPVIDGPLCAGSRRLGLRSLVPGSTLVAKQGNTIVGRGSAYADVVEMWIEPLADNGQPVVVTATLCGVDVDSYPENVTPVPQQIPACQIAEPLVACAMSLWLTNAQPGALAAAFSDQRGQISEWVRVRSAEALLPLYSGLQAGHRIRVEQITCGGAPVQSQNSPEVQAVPSLHAPTMDGPVFADHRLVHVRGAQPGALVQLYAREAGFISQAIADPRGEVWLPSSGPINTMIAGWHLWARQLLCDQISGFSEPFQEVVDRTPLQPVLTAPPNGATGVGKRPQLWWTDPGAGTVRQASSFHVQLTTIDHPTFDAWVVNDVVTSNSYALDQDLIFGQQYIWRVTAVVGDPGWEVSSPHAQASFTIQGAPPPPPPPPTRPTISVAYQGPASSAKFTITGSGFLPNHTVHIRGVNHSNYIQTFFLTTSSASGTIQHELNGAVPAGSTISFSANDERSDSSDMTGTLWSNTVTLTVT